MKTHHAILIGAAVIAAIIFLTNGTRTAETHENGAWQISSAGIEAGGIAAWRINTETGYTEMCAVGGYAGAEEVIRRCFRLPPPGQ